MKVNEEIISADCKTKKICKPGNEIVTENITPCGENSHCGIESGRYACVCKENFILQNGKCVHAVNPCQNNPCKNGGTCINKGFDYTCQCTANYFGRFCEQVRKCTCNVYGDRHYKTFDGERIYFVGGCKYSLATTKQGYNNTYFSVEVKNEHRRIEHVTYTRSRSLDIKLENNTTISLLPANRILMNSVERSPPIIKYGDFSVNFAVGWVTVTTRWGLTVRFDGKHRISVSLPLSFANKLTGICGNCNGIKDDLRTKSGQDVSSHPNKFTLIGDSYQIADDSDKLEDSCKSTPANYNCETNETAMCDVIINGKAFQKCVEILGSTQAKQFIDSCRIDVCSHKNDEDNVQKAFCQILEGFASQCENAGVIVDWRKEVSCPKFCPSFQEYRYNTSTCQPTCLNLKPVCMTRTEGCICQPGYVLSGNECVSPSKCGCRNANFYMTLKEEIYSTDCNTKYVCLGRNEVQKRPAACQENSHCTLENNKRMCTCDNGYIMSEGKCIKEGTMDFVRVIKAYIKGIPMLSYVSNDIKQCSSKCLEIDECKSFNYDTKFHICELFTINAASSTVLTSRGCYHKVYYQRVLSKNTSINGASIIDCHTLEVSEGISTIKLCEAKCLLKKCSAFDYSKLQRTCRIMLSTKTEFQLTGDEKKTFVAITY
ncbi:zonadhesin-like [Octopus sinensis]|uniref:Zonadhesin-like n=1 Tax=Octopus sinensis TaxID=2607531 RepID=A0A7E6EPC4_9MOLL|nr:zonadhesin-like [Octopus sinensis]